MTDSPVSPPVSALRELAQWMVAERPAREALAARVLAAPQWSLPDVGPARARGGPTGPEARRLELTWLVLALAADPVARAGIEDLLTPDERSALTTQESALTAPQLRWLRSEIDLSDSARVTVLRERLADLFARAAAADTALPTPELALDAYLAQPGRTRAAVKAYDAATKTRFATAVFETGRYDPSLDEALRAQGFHAVAIASPSPNELDRFGEGDGFHLRSQQLHWVTAAASLEAFVEALPGTSLRTGFRHKLKQSEHCPPDIGPLTEERYQAWRPIFAKEIASRPGGFPIYGPGFVQERANDGSLSLWQSVLFRAPEDPSRVIGGALLLDNVRFGGIVTVGGAAYDAAFRNLHLPIRTMATVLELAAKSEVPIVSQGTDVNFYGFMLSLGLMGFKSSLGLTPHAQGPFELFKLLDAAPFATEASGFLFFSVRRGSPLERRYREAIARDPQPLGRELSGGRFGSAEALDPAHNLVGQHYTFGAGPMGTPTPHRFRIVHHRVGP